MKVLRGRSSGAITGIPQQNFSIRCPGCRQMGSFHPYSGIPDLSLHLDGRNPVGIGHRQCPNVDCFAHVLAVYGRAQGNSGNLLEVFPGERIDFDSSEVPERIVRALEEAIVCHANSCFTAAAIMVRKSLELLCDERGAEGRNLKERIKDLRGKVILPDELLDGIDALRLLGNDAAHVNATVYSDVGREEVEIGIDLTKEVLKALYQYAALIQRLKARQVPDAS